MTSTSRPRQAGRPSGRPSGRTSSPDSWLHLDRQLCFGLYSVSLAMTKLYKPLLEPMGITYPQYLAMLVLWEQDAVTVRELGERLHLDSGTLTPLLKRLESAGLVTRERATDDERRVVVGLTIAGRALREQARMIPRRLAEATGCDATELHRLVDQLKALRDRIDVH